MKTRGLRLWPIVVSFVAVSAVLLNVSHPAHKTRLSSTTSASPSTTTTVRAAVATLLPQPAVLTSRTISLVAAPVAVPMMVEIPSIGVSSHVLAVGMTAAHAMYAPEGGPNSPNWGDTFWYRGSSLPGVPGTATIAGHIDDAYGRYAVFGRLSSLVPGNQIIVHYPRSGLTVTFKVTATHAYTLAQSTTLPVLDLIYGYGPPHGRGPTPSKDGRAHLSLVTCAGTWNSNLSTHNERLVVSAVRIS
jgi:sortase (surface protein transpeptidase)